MTSKGLFSEKFIISFIVALMALFSVASASPPPRQKMDRLIVYGDQFMFGVKEPGDWQGDTERAAALKMNILFYSKGPLPSNLEGVIRVRVNKKTDENTAEDLAMDMEGYQKRFAEVRFEDFAVSHPQYSCYSKLFFVEGRFHEYVTYVNPGEGFWYMFSLALNTGEETRERC